MIYSSSNDDDSNFSVGGSMNSSLSVLGMEKESVRYFQHQRESYDGIRKHLSQQFNSSRASVEPKIIYNGTVYNNCSFGNVSKNKENLSNVVGKKGVLPPHFGKKRRITGEVGSKKKMFKTAKELGLSLN